MQDAETGAAGRDFGFRMAAYVINSMKLRRMSGVSNEVAWMGQRAVLKSCGRKTSWYGVTVGTLERIDVILAAFIMAGRTEVWVLTVDDFKIGMRDSRSKSANGKVKQVSRGYTRRRGIKVAELQILTLA